MDEVNAAFEKTVTDHYADLYRFAFSLSHNEADATDLTQQTFLRYATKGHQIRDVSRTKSWLFRTLKNEFLSQALRARKFQHVAFEEAAHDGSDGQRDPAQNLDGRLAVEALQQVDATYRIALSLYYMKGLSYREIAETLEVPIGTVMSRLSRGKNQLKEALGARI